MPSTNVGYKQLLGGLLCLLAISASSPPTSSAPQLQEDSTERVESDGFGVGAARSLHAAQQHDGASCVPREQCCKVCSQGKACGNSCIRASYTCHKGVGCACDEENVCD